MFATYGRGVDPWLPSSLLSPQDCVPPQMGYDLSMGNCSGGYIPDVLTFASTNGSISERLYPTTSKNVTGCKTSMVAGLVKQRPEELVLAGPAPGYERAKLGKAGMLKAVAQQPVASYIAVEETFQVSGRGAPAGGGGPGRAGASGAARLACCLGAGKSPRRCTKCASFRKPRAALHRRCACIQPACACRSRSSTLAECTRAAA